jgi:putative Ca2+/H+ antiporter (TMEM165/GDT1 family)
MLSFLAVAATAFILIVPVELPDKTFLATILLTTRYRALPVWLGVSAAFFVQCVVAVAAGKLLNLLPGVIVQWAVAVMFAVFAFLLFRWARQKRANEDSDEAVAPVEHRGGIRAFSASFLVLFAAEWGDLSQLLTAGLVAKGYDPVAVFLGSWIGLCAVSGAAVLLGRALLKRVRPSIVTYVAAALCAVFAVITAVSAAK